MITIDYYLSSGRIMEKQEKLVALYDTSLKIFAQYGYKKTTMEDIATALDMTKGNLYLYAQNKKDLYESTVAYALKNWQLYAASAMDAVNDIYDKIKTYTEKGYEYLCLNGDLRQIILQDPSIFPLSTHEDRFNNINTESMGILKELLEEGIRQNKFRKIDVQVTAELLYSIYVMFIIKTYVKSEFSSPEILMESALDLLLNGIKKV